MTTAVATAPAEPGPLLQYWRRARKLSQLALANEAEVSPRHVCFLETGRAKPSREMLLRLAETLEIPLRERNALLLSAGFAPMFPESTWDAPAIAAARAAIGAILRQQAPYPAVVMDRAWDVVEANEPATRFFALLLGERRPSGAGNVLRLMFEPDGLRPNVENWEEVARALLGRLQREAVGGVLDGAANSLLADLLALPGVPREWAWPGAAGALLPILPVTFRHGPRRFNYFSTVTVLGTPQDVTLQELRIECFFPLDEPTAAAARALMREDDAGQEPVTSSAAGKPAARGPSVVTSGASSRRANST